MDTEAYPWAKREIGVPDLSFGLRPWFGGCSCGLSDKSPADVTGPGDEKLVGYLEQQKTLVEFVVSRCKLKQRREGMLKLRVKRHFGCGVLGHTGCGVLEA